MRPPDGAAHGAQGAGGWQNVLGLLRLLAGLPRHAGDRRTVIARLLLNMLCRPLILTALAATCQLALGQRLPAPSREVYRCELDGQVSYSNTPCLGARRVDVEPTRGLNKSSGKDRTGADVRKERNNEMMADALRPVFGESATQRARRHHRARLDPIARAACERLDASLPPLEHKQNQVAKADLSRADERLLIERQQFQRLGC